MSPVFTLTCHRLLPAPTMGLLERCEELFKTSNLYEVLGVAKEATDAELRRGYYKVSLQVHPDRAQGDELATDKFQVMCVV